MKQRFNEPAPASGRVPHPVLGAQAVARALAVLQAFDGDHATWELGALSSELGLHKTTVSRLLGALEQQGFVARVARGYRLGPSLITLGAIARRTGGLAPAARPALERLGEETGETATLEVLAGEDVVIVDEVRGHFLVGSRPEIGTHWPAHATSTGKVLLAAARFWATGIEAAARPVPVGARLERHGPRTITTRARLERELAKVWRQGFAVGTEELEPGFVAVAAPVRDVDGRSVAAISIGGPGVRLTRSRLPALIALVRESADRVSRRLGAPSASMATPST